MANKFRTKQELLDLGLTLTDQNELLLNGKKLTKYNMNGYLGYNIYLGKVNDKYKSINILEHTLIWLWHRDEIPKRLRIVHIDRNIQNNSISNLRLSTRKEPIVRKRKNKRYGKDLYPQEQD